MNSRSMNQKSMTEAEASRDLAILHYPGKWKAAKQYCMHNDQYAHPGEGYWAHVRRTYLEVGGEFVGQLCARQRAQYMNGAYSA
jgi:hypothetical protein